MQKALRNVGGIVWQTERPLKSLDDNKLIESLNTSQGNELISETIAKDTFKTFPNQRPVFTKAQAKVSKGHVSPHGDTFDIVAFPTQQLSVFPVLRWDHSEDT